MKLEKKAAAQRQWQAEEDERNVECFTDSFSLEPYICTAETRAELEDSMYYHKKRVTFSHAITRRMTAERNFWGNDDWEEGPRNGQVNGVCYNKDLTATWEEVQAAERLAKQQPRRSRNNNRRIPKSKKLAKDLEIQRSKSEFESWRTLVLLTSVQNGDEGVAAACVAGMSGRSEGARLAGAWWRRKQGRTKADFRIYVDALHKIKGECRQVWDVICRWVEAYFRRGDVVLALK